MNRPQAVQCVRLPRLVAGSSVWQLPISDYGAYELAHLLVVDDLQERVLFAAQLMSIDPTLTLWAACLWESPGVPAEPGLDDARCGAPRCVMDLARFLATRAEQYLCWDEDAPQLSAGRAGGVGVLRARWRELAADAVAAAVLAADPVADDTAAAECFLLGLLHNAADWLRTAGPRISVPKGRFGCLPLWLGEPLRDRARAARSTPWGQVMHAARRWRESGRRHRLVDGVDVTDALLARRRWQLGSAAMESGRHLLVSLTRKLQTLHRLETDFHRALEQEKLASLGELAYGASHEINNPLANISTRAQALMAGEPDAERRRMLAIINSQAFRANEMIADMMLFARPPALVCQPVDLPLLIDELLAELRPDAELQATQLSRTGEAGPIWVSADRTQLAMALRAVVINALQALGAEGVVEIRLQRRAAGSAGEPEAVGIHIRDTGPGMSEQVRRHLFDPFFSGREAGRGLGFGMAKCWRVVTMHGGSIDVLSVWQQGTTVSVSLPCVEAPLPTAGDGAVTVTSSSTGAEGDESRWGRYER